MSVVGSSRTDSCCVDRHATRLVALGQCHPPPYADRVYYVTVPSVVAYTSQVRCCSQPRQGQAENGAADAITKPPGRLNRPSARPSWHAHARPWVLFAARLCEPGQGVCVYRPPPLPPRSSAASFPLSMLIRPRFPMPLWISSRISILQEHRHSARGPQSGETSRALSPPPVHLWAAKRPIGGSR
jgi:hypothetical protein